MAETLEEPDRNLRELIEGMKEGAQDMISGETETENKAIRNRIRELKEDL